MPQGIRYSRISECIFYRNLSSKSCEHFEPIYTEIQQHLVGKRDFREVRSRCQSGGVRPRCGVPAWSNHPPTMGSHSIVKGSHLAVTGDYLLHLPYNVHGYFRIFSLDIIDIHRKYLPLTPLNGRDESMNLWPTAANI